MNTVNGFEFKQVIKDESEQATEAPEQAPEILPFVRSNEDIYKDQDFISRIKIVGKKLFDSVVKLKGSNVSKSDIFTHGEAYTVGMDEKEKATFWMCIFEAVAQANAALHMFKNQFAG